MRRVVPATGELTSATAVSRAASIGQRKIPAILESADQPVAVRDARGRQRGYG
jgi:hypothetical protein